MKTWQALFLFFLALFTATVAAKCAKATPVYVSGCSGTAIGNGYILTAGHCVEGKSETQVKLDNEDKTYWEAETVFTDHRRDFALLKVGKFVTPADEETNTREKKEDKPLDVAASKISCEYPKMGQHYKIKGWPAMVGYTEVIAYIAGDKKKRGPWNVSYVAFAPIFYGNSGSPGYNPVTDQVEIVVVGMMPGTSLALVIPTAEICNILPR